MSTIRVAKRENPYITIDKYAIDNDARISWQAKGLLTYLIGKPNDWVVRIGDLVKRSRNGEDAVRAIMNELIAAGYIEREQSRASDGSGKFAEISHVVYETPLHDRPIKSLGKGKFAPVPENPDTVEVVDKSPQPENPDTVKPDAGNPDSENPVLVINDSSNLDSSKEEEDSPTPTPAFPSRLIAQDIQRFKSTYPQYTKVTEDIGAAAIMNRRPVLAEEEFFLEKASSINMRPEILWNIYQAVKPEIDRSSGCDRSRELIESVFNKFAFALKKGRITIDAAAWFATAWFNERNLMEQAEMMH